MYEIDLSGITEEGYYSLYYDIVNKTTTADIETENWVADIDLLFPGTCSTEIDDYEYC